MASVLLHCSAHQRWTVVAKADVAEWILQQSLSQQQWYCNDKWYRIDGNFSNDITTIIYANEVDRHLYRATGVQWSKVGFGIRPLVCM